MMDTWTMDGLVFTLCHPKPEAMFAPFWWIGHPEQNKHLTFDCPGEILLALPWLKGWISQTTQENK